MTRLAGRVPRRGVLRWALALASIPMARPAAPAAAARGWCPSDPVVKIGDAVVDIVLEARYADLPKVTGPNRIVVTVPKGVDAKLILAGPGFLKGEKVSFAESRHLTRTGRRVEVRVSAFVPASDDDMPVRLKVTPRIGALLAPDRVRGTANSRIVLTTHV